MLIIKETVALQPTTDETQQWFRFIKFDAEKYPKAKLPELDVWLSPESKIVDPEG